MHTDERTLLWQDSIPAGAGWSHILRRGNALRITAPEAGANVGAMFYNADSYIERYNMEMKARRHRRD